MAEDAGLLAKRLGLFQSAAQAVLTHYDWQLLTPKDLANEAIALSVHDATTTQAEAERICQQAYARCLHAAAHDPAHQQQAYCELHAYLYRIASRQRAAFAEDAAQEAILLIHQKLGDCRTPGAFLKFAIFQLLTAFRRLAPTPHEIPLENLLATDDGEWDNQPSLNSVVLPETEVLEHAEIIELLQWLHGMIEANPRARKQILAVALKYLEEWDDEAIAAELETTVANVHVLRSRGLAKLRAEYQKHLESVQDS